MVIRYCYAHTRDITNERKMNEQKTVKRVFPKSTIGTVSQNGVDQSARHTGVTVELHWREEETVPCSAEVHGGGHYADIGLEWDGNTLTGYDGVFELPAEVKSLLLELGFTTSEFI